MRGKEAITGSTREGMGGETVLSLRTYKNLFGAKLTIFKLHSKR